MEVVLDREELYQDVWSKRPSAVARKYGLDEGDIRRACFVLDVPRPDRGYWAKLQRDDAPPVVPLPQKSGASTYKCQAISNAARGALNPKPAKPKESLIDWVLKNRTHLNTAGSTRTLPPPPTYSMHLLPEDTAKLPRYLPLEVWATLLLGEHAPHKNTLLRWVHNGKIYPRAIKVGALWCVRKDAAYLPD